MWDGPCWEGVWQYLDPLGCRGPAHDSQRLEGSGEVRAARRAPFLPHSEGAFRSYEGGGIQALCYCGDTESMCTDWFAPDGRKNASVSSGCLPPDVGDTWRNGCPKSPDWDSDVVSWTESEGASSFDQYEHNVESLALDFLGQNWSGEKISLFLEDWEFAKSSLELPHSSWYVVPGNA